MAGIIGVALVQVTSQGYPTGQFILAGIDSGDRVIGYLHDEGSFNSSHNSRIFRSREEAIRWAEEPPRYWRVLNAEESGTYVVVCPPAEGPNPTDFYLVARTSRSGDFDGFAKADGSFTRDQGLGILDQFLYAIHFSRAEDAISWAKLPPRRWNVINEKRFG